MSMMVSKPAALAAENEAGSLLNPALQMRVDLEHLDLPSSPVSSAVVKRRGLRRRRAVRTVSICVVELPCSPLREQRWLGEAMHGIAQFDVPLDDAAALGRQLVHGLTDVLVQGRLDQGGKSR